MCPALFVPFDKVSPPQPAGFIVRLGVPVDPHGIKPWQRREKPAQLGFNGTPDWAERMQEVEPSLGSKVCWFHLQEYYSWVGLVSVQRATKTAGWSLWVFLVLDSFVLTGHLHYFWKFWNKSFLASLIQTTKSLVFE